jgi:hypothetical protein
MAKPRNAHEALVGALRGQRRHREGEGHGEADVAQIEERRVGHHVRVLEAGIEPDAVRRRGGRRERRGDEDEEEREERRERPQDRHSPRKDVGGEPSVQGDGGRARSGEDEQPEEQRPLLSAPERRHRVTERKFARGVVGDVDEGEVVANERREEDDRRDAYRPESGEEGVGRRLVQPPATAQSRVTAGDRGVEDEHEGDDERGAAELRH